MAVTQVNYTGNNSTTNYSFTFPYLDKTDVKVRIDGTTQPTTAYSFANATTISMDTAPSTGAKIVIFRDTNNDSKKGSFYAGSAIKAEDLNDNFDQILYTAQEVDNNAFQASGATPMTGDIQLADGTGVIFEGTTDDAFETTLKVVDPTADRAINLPNVSGTVITTGDTGTITSTMIQNATIDTANLQSGAVTGAKIANDTITATQIAADAVTASELANNAVDTAAIAADAVTGAKIADDSINSEHYVAGSIDTEHVADSHVTTAKLQDAAVTTVKIANSSVDSTKLANASVVTDRLADNAVATAKIVDDAITTDKIAASQVTTAKVANLAISEAKLSANAVTTDKIAADAITGAKIADDSIDSEHIVDGSIDAAHIADNAVTTAKIVDAELTTLAGMQSATASILAAGTNLTATLAEINSVVDGKAPQTTITDDDTKYPTSGAVVDYVAAQIAPIGGLEVIATDAAFPNTQPASGVVISISDAGGVVFNGSGSSTTGRTVGGSTVTINNAPSSLNSETLVAGVGLMVSSTGSSQTYNYHKILGKEDDIKQLSDDINDFNARYRVNAGEPSSNNDEGDLVYDTSANKMKVYDGSTWGEVTSTGDFKYLFLCPAGGTGAPTINGSIATYDLREGSNSGSAASVTNAAQLMVSVDGVIQKANTGTSAPSEGFALVDSNTIIFGANLASGSSVFIVQFGSALTINVPGDNTVATAKIQNGAVTLDKMASEAVDEDNLKISNAGSNGQYLQKQSGNAGGLTWATVDTSTLLPLAGGTITGNVLFNDSVEIRLGTDNDLALSHDGSNSYFVNKTGSFHLYAKAGEAGLVSVPDGTTKLYYDGSKKIETTSSGTSVSGSISVDAGSNTTQAIFSGSGGAGARGLAILTEAGGAADEGVIFNARASGTTATMKFQTNGSTALTIQGEGDEIDIPDNTLLRLGTGNDLQLQHDGSASIIKHTNANNDFYIQSDSHIRFTDIGGNETFCKFTDNGDVELYYDDSKKLETHASGVEIGGKLTFSGDGNSNGIELGADADLNLYHDNSNAYIDNNVGDFYIRNDGSSTSEKIRIQAKGGEQSIVCTPNSGVELYYDNTLTCYTSNGCLSFPDSQKLFFGAGNDLQLFHDGSNSYIKDAATGALYIDGSSVRLRNYSNSETMAEFIGDGEVKLYYNNSVKFETTNNGSKTYNELDIVGAEGTSANLYLRADEGDDNGDGWRIGSNQDDNDLTFANNISGSYVDKLTLFHNKGMKLVASSGEDCIIEMWADNGENNNDGWQINNEDGNSFNIMSYEDGSWERRFHIGSGDDGSIQLCWSNQADLTDGGISFSNSNIGTKFYATGDSTANVILFYNPSNGNVGKIQTVNTQTNFVTSSDYRLKENNVPLENAITKLKALKPYTFNFKKQPSIKIDGFYAHEADTVVPQAVTGDKDAMTEDEKGATVIDPQGVDYGMFTPLLTKALQEAIAKIETLETKVAALEAA